MNTLNRKNIINVATFALFSSLIVASSVANASSSSNHTVDEKRVSLVANELTTNSSEQVSMKGIKQTAAVTSTALLVENKLEISLEELLRAKVEDSIQKRISGS